MADCIAQAALDKKAEDVVILDLRKLDTVCDYFVICTGEVDQQVRAIANHIEDMVREKTREKVFGREGKVKLDWVLLDYVDVVAHIFKPSTRQFYRLEDLWGDSELIPISDTIKSAVRKPRTAKKAETSEKSSRAAKTTKASKEKVVRTKAIRKPKSTKPVAKQETTKKTAKKTSIKTKP